MTKTPSWLYRSLGEAIATDSFTQAQGRPPTADEIAGMDEEELITLGWDWRNENLGQLHALARVAVGAEAYLHRSPGHAINHIMDEGPRALGPLGDEPAGKYLIHLMRTSGQGNREQAMILLGALQRLGYQD